MAEKAIDQGWIKLHRKLKDHPRFSDGAWLQVFSFLLLTATHKTVKAVFNGGVIELKPGQLITGRTEIARKCKLHESSVDRKLKCLEIEQQIEQRTCPEGRLITILNWQSYQQTEQPIEQRANDERTTNEQRANTYKNDKNDKNTNPPPVFSELPRIEEVLAEASLRGYKKEAAENFYHHFEASGWVNGNGIPVRNWRSRMHTWMATEREKEFLAKEKGGKEQLKQTKEGIKIKEIQI